MSFILRAVRKSRWLDFDGQVSLHLSDEDIKMGPLIDLKVDDNGRLSVWHINDDMSNFQRVVAALAATRDHTSNMDYVLFDQRVFSEINIERQHTTGESPDDEANALWHRELVGLSTTNLIDLVSVVLKSYQENRNTIGRISEKEIKSWIAESIVAGYINPKSEKLGRGILGKVKPLLPDEE